MVSYCVRKGIFSCCRPFWLFCEIKAKPQEKKRTEFFSVDKTSKFVFLKTKKTWLHIIPVNHVTIIVHIKVDMGACSDIGWKSAMGNQSAFEPSFFIVLLQLLIALHMKMTLSKKGRNISNKKCMLYCLFLLWKLFFCI